MFDSRSKYNNRKTEVDGFLFDSKKEAERYGDLRLLEKAGEIADLMLQPVFICAVNGVKVCTYRADFSYSLNGQTVIEDVKGFRTKEYRIKKKLVQALYGIEIKEI